MQCGQLLGTFDIPAYPAALPFAPGAATYAMFLFAAVALAVVWRRPLPEWCFPLKSRWLRYFLTGVVSAAALATYLVLCSMARYSETPLLW